MKKRSYCVYLLNEADSTIYKIGYTSKLAKRIRRLSYERNCPLIIADAIYVDFQLLAKRTEETLHEVLKEYAIGNEWFDLPSVDVWDMVATNCVIRAAESLFSKRYARVYGSYSIPVLPKRKKLNWLDYLDRAVNLENMRDSVVSFETYLKSRSPT